MVNDERLEEVVRDPQHLGSKVSENDEAEASWRLDLC